MKWHKRCPRKSGYYFVSFDSNDCGRVYDVMLVEGRDKKNDGWVWLPDGAAGRYYLTKGVRDEYGDGPQSTEWALWEWAGPIQEPKDE